MTEEERSKRSYANNYHQKMELFNAQGKIGYWKSVGAVVVDPILQGKWEAFVEQIANNTFAPGELLDELIQVMTMIKAGIPYDSIKNVISEVHSETLVDYLGAFIHPEIVDAVNPYGKVK